MMPPEPLPWDRKDFFKERKHERQEPYHHHHHHHHLHPTGGGGGGGGGGYGGGIGGFGGGPRWREPPHPHPHPYHYASPRWVSDFRYRPPPGEFLLCFCIVLCLLSFLFNFWISRPWVVVLCAFDAILAFPSLVGAVAVSFS